MQDKQDKNISGFIYKVCIAVVAGIILILLESSGWLGGDSPPPIPTPQIREGIPTVTLVHTLIPPTSTPEIATTLAPDTTRIYETNVLSPL